MLCFVLSFWFGPNAGPARVRLLAIVPVIAALLASGLSQPGVAAARSTASHVQLRRSLTGRAVNGSLGSHNLIGVAVGGGVTFGNATVGASTNAPGSLADRKRVNRATPLQSGRVTSLSIYLQPSGTAGTQVLRGLVYADSGGSPGALLAVSDEQTFSSTMSAGWYVLTFPNSPPVTAGTPYWIGLITGATAAIVEYHYTSVSGARDVNPNPYTAGASDPFSASVGVTTDDQSMSLFGTIAPTGSPVVSAAPRLSDTASAGGYQVGDSLSVSSGTWSPSASTYTYQWQHCDSAGSQCRDISTATSQAYTLASGDAGGTVRAVVAAANSTGATSATSPVSSVVTVTPTAPVNTVAPVIAGSPVQGTILTTTTGTWSNSPTSYSYQWEDCNSAGAGCANATGAGNACTNNGTPGCSYTLVSADVKSTMRIMVTAGNAARSGSPATSAQTAVIGGISPAMFYGAFTAGSSISSAEFPRQSFVAGHVTAMPDPDGSGVAVARYAIANGDQPYSGSHPRGDMLTTNWYKQGSTLYTSIPVKIPTGLPLFHNSGSSFFQWAEAKDTAASFPSWGFGLNAPGGASQDSYTMGTTNGYYPWLGPVVDGKWHTATVLAYYTSAPGQGWVELWWDGAQVTFNNGAFAGKTRVTGITTITDGASAWPLDIDNYRSANTDAGTLTIYHGPPRIGTTLASVAPAAGPAGP